MRAIIVKPPQVFTDTLNRKKIFLAGSIDLGKAEDWQSKIIEAVKEFDLVIFNPRRDDWDESWVQSMDNPEFVEQVEWELEHLEASNKIVLVLTKDSLAPISLLEFGLFAKSGKMVVYCPNGFWRKGNVDIVCKRYGVPQVEKFEELITLIKYS